LGLPENDDDIAKTQLGRCSECPTRDLTDELDIPAVADEFVRGNSVRKDIFG